MSAAPLFFCGVGERSNRNAPIVEVRQNGDGVADGANREKEKERIQVYIYTLCVSVYYIAAVEETRGGSGGGRLFNFTVRLANSMLFTIYINIMYTNVRLFVCVARYLVRKTNIRDGNDEPRNLQRGYRGYGLVFFPPHPHNGLFGFYHAPRRGTLSSARRARRRVYRNLTHIDTL